MRSLDIAATGMQAQQLYVDVTSQNLANVNTTAYKLQRPNFQDLLYQNQRTAGANSSDSGTIVPTGTQIGLGVKTASISRDSTQGTMQSTSNPLDVAVQGKGFFKIQYNNGEEAYTRDGSFQLSPDGKFVTTDGFVLDGDITIPPEATSVNINQSGEVSYKTQGDPNPQLAGKIQLVSFVNDAGLQAIGNNLFTETAASGSATPGDAGIDGRGTLLQGFLESSNVNPVTELTNLIKAQRVYEMCSKVIEKSDAMAANLAQSV
jgi:flagellar basal-body rod protein FlgG